MELVFSLNVGGLDIASEKMWEPCDGILPKKENLEKYDTSVAGSGRLTFSCRTKNVQWSDNTHQALGSRKNAAAIARGWFR